MKKLTILFLPLLFTYFCFAQRVNDKVQISYKANWFKGTILEIKDSLFYVTYDEWSGGRNEWVTIDRLQGFNQIPPKENAKFKAGDKVEVKYNKEWEPATIMEVGESSYRIKYDNPTHGDKWVEEAEISWPW